MIIIFLIGKKKVFMKQYIDSINFSLDKLEYRGKIKELYHGVQTLFENYEHLLFRTE